MDWWKELFHEKKFDLLLVTLRSIPQLVSSMGPAAAGECVRRTGTKHQITYFRTPYLVANPQAQTPGCRQNKPTQFDLFSTSGTYTLCVIMKLFES